jgi:hypothetical protein
VRRLLGVLLTLVACAPLQMWVPIGDPAPRTAKAPGSVVLLEREPTDRSFEVIGLIVPPEDEFETYAAMINAARVEAAKRGADAMFIASETDKSGWGFSGMSGGSVNTTAVRIKAIVWKN